MQTKLESFIKFFLYIKRCNVDVCFNNPLKAVVTFCSEIEILLKSKIKLAGLIKDMISLCT